MAELNPRRWARIEEIYSEASTRPHEGRRQYLAGVCADDGSLEEEILAMLAADETGPPLEIERLVRDGGDVPDPLLATTIGRWRIVSALGRGGTGAVYLVERCDGQYDQQAALKLLAPGLISSEAAARLAAERRILARLVHPHIARLIDGGLTSNGTQFLVMEYVEGQPLTAYCDERRLGIDERLRLFQVVCGAVQHAHRALVVHRDLKPSNIYVSRSGDVKLLDFGIAKLLDDEPFLPLTRTGLRPLTLAYAAPEQLRGDVVTTAADVYALGVVLYELLAGRRPHALDALSPLETERAILETEPQAPSAVAPARAAKRIRGDLDRICLMALRKEPERRYQSVEQFAADIERLLTGRPVIAQPDTVRYRMGRFVRRNRVPVAVGALFVMTLSAFAATAILQARQVATERDRAQLERDKAQRVVRMIIDLFQAANPEIVPEGEKQTVGEFLAVAEQRVLSGLGDDLELSAAIKDVLGQVHDARSDYRRSRALLEQALAESRERRGADDRESLGIQVTLGGVLGRLDDVAAARPLLDDAIARCVRTVGEQHALTARALFARGNVSGTSEEARPFLERALTIRRAVLAADDADLALTLNSLAIRDLSDRRFEIARARFEEALRVTQATNGGRNTTALAVLNNMAVLQVRMGDFAGAEAAHKQGLVLALELRGPNSMAVATAYNNLATLFANQGKLEDAREHFQQAYDRYVAVVGATHSRTANAARNLAVSLLLLERPAEALPWMDRALRAVEVAHGAASRETTFYKAQLGSILSAAGRHGEAIRILEPATERLVALAPPEGDGTLADARLYLGHTLVAAGRPAEAEPHYRAALAFRERASGDPRLRASLQCELARMLAATGRLEDARPLLDACLPVIRDYGLFHRSCREEVLQLQARLRAK